MALQSFSLRRVRALQQQRTDCITHTTAAIRCQASSTTPSSVPTISFEDKWLTKNVAAFVQQLDNGSQLSALRSSCQSALSTLRMPSTRNEEYRYTDISPLLSAQLTVPPADAAVDVQQVQQLMFPESAGSRVVIVNGVFRPELSDLAALPPAAYVGGSSSAPLAVLEQLGAQSNSRGGPFAVLNGSLAQDALVVHLPANTSMEQPLYILHISTPAATSQLGSNGSSSGNCLNASAPRLLVSLAGNARLEMVEEYVTDAGASHGSHVTMPVAEVALGPAASLKHGYINREGAGAQHFKATLVSQAEGSVYELVEVRIGGCLTRHDLGIVQDGPDTTTTMKHFLLAGVGELQDLHSKLQLNHPRGVAEQLHKCIAGAASARGVFDGNVKVNRLAQKTDAGQLSRNLLLVPKATVNVKPNLQIIADDVKCTHGCAVSDLSEEELFYFRARGVSYDQARQALVYSFGAEVVQELKYDKLVSRIQQDVVTCLKNAAADK